MNAISSPNPSEFLARGGHVNVPTLVVDKMPEAMQLLYELFAFVEHGRPIVNTAHVQHLHDGLLRAEGEVEEKKARHQKHKRQLARTRKTTEKRKLEAQINALQKSHPERGTRIRVLCKRTHADGRQEQVHLSTRQVLGSEAIARPEQLEFCGALVRRGKTIVRLDLLATLREELVALHATQALPHLFRGLPILYASCFALARDHGRAHDLSPGSFFYARHGKSTGKKCASTLMLARRGYAVGNQNAAGTMHLQVELLKCIRLSGEHAGMSFEDMPLLVESTRFYQGQNLPAGVRAGMWSTLQLPEELWQMQGDRFAQVPEALLETHDLYAANLGLVLKAREAYAGHEDSGEHGIKLGTARLIEQAGLRQAFRACASRDRELLARSLGDLEAMGFVTRVATEELEELCSTPANKAPEESTPRERSGGKKRAPVRRRFDAVRSKKKVFVRMYGRILPDHSPPDAQRSLLSSS